MTLSPGEDRATGAPWSPKPSGLGPTFPAPPMLGTELTSTPAAACTARPLGPLPPRGPA